MGHKSEFPFPCLNRPVTVFAPFGMIWLSRPRHRVCPDAEATVSSEKQLRRKERERKRNEIRIKCGWWWKSFCEKMYSLFFESNTKKFAQLHAPFARLSFVLWHLGLADLIKISHLNYTSLLRSGEINCSGLCCSQVNTSCWPISTPVVLRKINISYALIMSFEATIWLNWCQLTKTYGSWVLFQDMGFGIFILTFSDLNWDISGCCPETV